MPLGLRFAPESMYLVGVWLVTVAVNGPVAPVPRESVYPVGVGPLVAGVHETKMLPLVASLGSATAVTLMGASGGVQTGLAGTSA